jgi:hypothetical protein
MTDLTSEATGLLGRLDAHLSTHQPVLILAPPRSVSTAFARALGKHSAFDGYIHEPCCFFSYEDTTLQVVLDALGELSPRTLMKEMTFQIHDSSVAASFLRNCRHPILFLLRPPLLTIESRVRMVLTDLANDDRTSADDRARIEQAIEAKQYRELDDLVTEDAFPLYRTGWTDLGRQLAFCRQEGIDHVVVEAERFRNEPEAVLAAVCARLGLEFEPEMLHWASRSALPPGALERHTVWYTRFAESTSVLPPEAVTFDEAQLPARFRAHLPDALAVYATAVASPQCL